MEEKQAYISRELDEILRVWSARCALLGAAIFLALSALDFYSVPEYAVRFLGFRVVVAGFLVAVSLVLRRPQGRAATQLLVFLGVLFSAVALETMILDFGGHRSPYQLGLVLVAMVVAGLIPSGTGFTSLLQGTIFAVYLVPVLIWDTIDDPDYFTVSSALFFCTLTASVLVRWFHTRHLVRDISQRHALMQSRERLELEVAQRARTAAELGESREFLSSITAAVMDAIIMIDHEGMIRYWNPAAVETFGYEESEVLGRGPFTFLVAPDSAALLLADYRAWQETGDSAVVGRRVVNHGRRKNGDLFPMELAMAAVPHAGRLWACALLIDITERKSNENRLSLFAAAVEAAADGVFIIDLEGKVVYCNTSAAAQSERTRSEVMGRNISDLHQDKAVLENRILPAVRSVGLWAGEVPGKTRSGKPFALWLTASLVRNSEGRPIAMVGLTRNLTGQKQNEAERVRAQKIESIGVLAGGLAHDFNNLLTIILGNLDLARLFGGENPELAEALDHAGEATQRAGHLTRQLITFSKGGQPVKRVGSIAALVRGTAVFAAAGSNVACEFDVPDDLPLVDFDEGQMRQVIHNLVQNAREAMPEGGTLKISACALHLGEGEVPELPAGSYLRLLFADQGAGIAQEHLNRIFDPYFSTKEMDTVKGRGLGLAVSYSIVRNHNGAITAESLIGEGATVAVYLPEATRDADDEEETEEQPVPPPATAAPIELTEADRVPEKPPLGRVLVMDDEPLVLEMAGAALRRLGYAWSLSRSGAEAIVKYQIELESGKRFDAVILDLTVPGGMGGPETLVRLREIDPGVRAALSSGYSDHPAVADWAASGFKAFIAKPYSIKALEELLATLV